MSHPRVALLTPREREVLDLLARGGNNKSIAYDLGISFRTVEGMRYSMMRKMDARSVAEALRWAFAAGLGGPDRAASDPPDASKYIFAGGLWGQ